MEGDFFKSDIISVQGCQLSRQSTRLKPEAHRFDSYTSHSVGSGSRIPPLKNLVGAKSPYILAPQFNWLKHMRVTHKSAGSSPAGVVRDKPLTEQSITYLGSI